MGDWNDGTGTTYVNSSGLTLHGQYLLRCIMYYLLRYYKEETQLKGLFFTKGVLEFVVKTLDKFTYKESLKIPF